MEPTILYEDDDILAINKPAGLVVHSDGKTTEANVAEWVLGKYPATKDDKKHVALVNEMGVPLFL